jgi:S-adenosylmethionine hydrolase
VAEIVHVDHFGNLITNIGPLPWEQRAPDSVSVTIGKERVPFARTYSDVAPGKLVALVGSGGYLEIAVRNGSAAKLLGVDAGARVELSGM